jgi:hypothetical protein
MDAAQHRSSLQPRSRAAQLPLWQTRAAESSSSVAYRLLTETLRSMTNHFGGSSMKALNFVTTLGSLLLMAAGASALDDTKEPPYGFGHAGEFAFSSDAAVTIQHSSDDVTTIQLAPAADYFVIDNLSVGGFISLDYSKSGSSDGTRFGIGPRVGYNFGLSDTFSIWPKAGLAFAHSSVSTTVDLDSSTSRETSTSSNAIALNLFVPLMVHPVRHFFAGFGPFLDTDLSGSHRVTVIGGKLTLGGWLYSL